MPTESLNGVRIFYERQGVGPPIVLAHGSWGDHHSWDAVVPALAREYDVIRYDRRGVKDTFITNALTWPDELRDPGGSVVDLEALRRFDGPALFTTGTASASSFPPIVERIAAVLARAPSDL